MSKFELRCGNWNEEVEATDLEQAMNLADKEISYNQESMGIYENGELVAFRRWNSTNDGIEECENPIEYGEFGYYGDWEVEF
jgi:hypothetical protein